MHTGESRQGVHSPCDKCVEGAWYPSDVSARASLSRVSSRSRVTPQPRHLTTLYIAEARRLMDNLSLPGATAINPSRALGAHRVFTARLGQRARLCLQS